MRRYSKIGILGGSFNPIHTGHTAIAQMAVEELNLDLVLFIPAYVNPLKEISHDVTDKQRCFMIKEAITDNNSFELWEKELKIPTPSYTINTVERLSVEFSADEWYFCIGSDNLPQFVQWHRWSELIQKVKLAVCERPNFSIEIPFIIPHERVVFFEGPNWGISSTQIRKRLKQNKSCRYLLDKNVCRFIKENNLYEAKN
ncbi:MAG: nicotinate (nicotinamide) nucleotide adenylyltransferase [Chitinispirillales bacterium]|jgi:nicotinate-nucleotide adenylyltransferase|nr:nicotinate (nicotinamide) nucleotide adenylyltransferase [Chitinispirillales bacterium]